MNESDPSPQPSDEPRDSWLDIPGVAGMLGGVGFLVVTTVGYVVASLVLYGKVLW